MAKKEERRGRPRLPLPERWEEAVAAYEGGADCRDVVKLIGNMTTSMFYARYRNWCLREGRKPKRTRPQLKTIIVRTLRRPAVPKPAAPPPPQQTKERPTMSYYLSDEGMREFLKEGSGLAIEVKQCAKHGMDLEEGEDLRKRLRLKARDFLRLIKIAKEVG